MVNMNPEIAGFAGVQPHSGDEGENDGDPG